MLPRTQTQAVDLPEPLTSAFALIPGCFSLAPAPLPAGLGRAELDGVACLSLSSKDDAFLLAPEKMAEAFRWFVSYLPSWEGTSGAQAGEDVPKEGLQLMC